jgi:hypothetical protein
MWKVFGFDREHGSRRPWRPVLETNNATLACERFAREWATLRRGHAFLVRDGKVIRHARGRPRLRLVK